MKAKLIGQDLARIGAKLEPLIVVLILFFYFTPFFILPFRPNLSLLLYLLIPCLALLNIRKIFKLIKVDLIFPVLLLIVLLSLTWSAAPEAGLIIMRSFLLTTTFGIYLAARFSIEKLFKIIFWLFAASILLSFLLCITLPQQTIDFHGYWQGIFRQKNNFGLMTAFASNLFLMNFLYFKNRKSSNLFLVFLSFSLLILSQAKSSLILFFLSISWMPIYKVIKIKYKEGARIKIAVGIILVVIIYFLLSLVLSNLEFIAVDLLGKDLGGNGRDELWGYLIERAKRKPWLGYGYAGFWYSSEEAYGVWQNTWFQTPEPGVGHAHSGFIDLFLQLGVLGCVAMSINVINVFVKSLILAFHAKENKIYFFAFTQFIFIMMASNFSVGNSLLAANNVYWIIYISIYYSVLSRFSQLKYSKHVFNSMLPNNPYLLNHY